jgi:hypothetical protein
MKRYPAFTLLLLFLFVAGCGGGQVGALGTVVFSDDGSPVFQGVDMPHGLIIFSTPTFQARSEIDGQGRFTMSSFSANDGLPPGTYRVAIIAQDNTDPDNPYSLIDSKYSSHTTSELEITIEKTTRDIEFKVDRNPNPAR